MGKEFIAQLLVYLKGAVSPIYEEYFLDLEDEWYETYQSAQWPMDEFVRIYQENTGKAINLIHALQTMECEQLKFRHWPEIEVLRHKDAYESMEFRYRGDSYYVFSNYDESSLCDEYEFDGGFELLTSFLFFSIKERRFHAFHVALNKEEEYKIFNAQKSDVQPKLLVELLDDGEGFGKRSFYWHPKVRDVAIRFSEEGLGVLGKTSPEGYKENLSGTRLEIELFDEDDA